MWEGVGPVMARANQREGSSGSRRGAVRVTAVCSKQPFVFFIRCLNFNRASHLKNIAINKRGVVMGWVRCLPLTDSSSIFVKREGNLRENSLGDCKF
jgi:hypothetical protein